MGRGELALFDSAFVPLRMASGNARAGIVLFFVVSFVFPLQYRLDVGEAHSFEKDLGQRLWLAVLFVFVLIVIFAIFGGRPGGGSDGTTSHGGAVDYYAGRQLGLEAGTGEVR